MPTQTVCIPGSDLTTEIVADSFMLRLIKQWLVTYRLHEPVKPSALQRECGVLAAVGSLSASYALPDPTWHYILSRWRRAEQKETFRAGRLAGSWLSRQRPLAKGAYCTLFMRPRYVSLQGARHILLGRSPF